MKTVTLRVPKEQLSDFLAEVQPGDAVVITDGNRKIKLGSAADAQFDPEVDSVELGEELMKAASGPFTPYSHEDLDAIVERARKKAE